MRKIVLASKSPRRRELLGRLLDSFEVMDCNLEEKLVPGETPAETVCRLAGEKADCAAKIAGEDALVLAADTVVALDNKILGKPKDEEDAFSMLSALAGREHRVYTGIALADNATGKRCADYVCTGVWFRPMTETEIWDYIRSGEPMDKAGAYGIQDLGALLVEKIEGDYFNVVGLPLCRLGKLLEEEFSLCLLAHACGERQERG